jgi:hypothetical protein
MAKTDLLKKFQLKGGGYKITDASGRNMTVNKEALDSKGIDDYIDKNGNIYDTRNRPSNAGRRYKEDDGDWQAPTTFRTRKPITNNKTNMLYAGGSNNFNESTGRYEGGISSSPTTTSEANTISKSYDDQKNALIQRIRETVLQGTSTQKNIISQAPQQFQPLRNQVDINSSRGLQNLKETLANQGNITAGLGRQEIIQSGADRQNDINGINLQQQNIISQANQQIAQLQSEGRASEAQAISDNAMAKLQALVESNRRAEDVTYRNQQFGYQKSRDKIEDAFRQGQIDENARKYELDRIDQEEQLDYNRGQSEEETQYDRKQQEMQDFRDTIGQYGGDYKAEINNIVNDGDTSNDWKLPFLKAARAQKIKDQLEQGQKTADAEWTNAYKAWLQLTSGATAEMARILGIPKGTKAKDVIKTDYDTSKPYYKPEDGGSGITPPTWD